MAVRPCAAAVVVWQLAPKAAPHNGVKTLLANSSGHLRSAPGACVGRQGAGAVARLGRTSRRADQGAAQVAVAARAADRTDGCIWTFQSRDRRPIVPFAPDCRFSPLPGVPKAWDRIPICAFSFARKHIAGPQAVIDRASP